MTKKKGKVTNMNYEVSPNIAYCEILLTPLVVLPDRSHHYPAEHGLQQHAACSTAAWCDYKINPRSSHPHRDVSLLQLDEEVFKD